MKKIFDWMREEMQKRIDRCEANDTPDIEEGRRMFILGKQGGLEKAVELVDEAEAKWESDCCIRVVGKPFTSSCGQKYDKWLYVGESYCSKCGKPIKISEVE